MSTGPYTPSLGQLAQPRQPTGLAQSGSFDEFHETGPYRVEQCQLQLLLGAEVREHPAFGHSDADCNGPDQQSFDPRLLREVECSSEDQLPGRKTFFRVAYHEARIARPFVPFPGQ